MTLTADADRRATRQPDESMSLLAIIAADALDPGYQRAAQRRQRAARTQSLGDGPDGGASSGDRSRGDGGPADTLEADSGSGGAGGRIGVRRPRWVGSFALGLGLLAIGLLVSVAAARVQESASVLSSERESLIDRIRVADANTERWQDQIADLESDIRALESAQLQNSAEGEQLTDQTTAFQSTVGTRRVVGPGITVTLDDAPRDWPGWDPNNSHVFDIDIQQVVNALWLAGAEAVAVNGQRITPMTAIRSANDIVRVNYRPLSPPYHVSAVGDDGELAARFGQGPGGEWLRVAKQQFGIQSSISIADDDLVLPGGSAPLINAIPEETP